VDVSPLPGSRSRADLVFRRRKVAVFVDGCFWHGCAAHGTRPRTNGAWWREKIKRNVDRDRRLDAQLAAAGWTVLRVWEHDDLAEAADRVHAAVLAPTRLQEDR
jgi:DNA mismatch endonuclease (patch repair protein)